MLNETELTAQIDRAAAAQPVGPVPLEQMRTGASRRRGRRQLLSSVAGVAVVLGVIGGVSQLNRNDAPPPVAAPDGAASSSAPEPNADSRDLPCDPALVRGADLRIVGPGQPTPEQAVAPYTATERPELVVEVDAKQPGEAKVYEVSVGQVVRIFTVTEHKDGWWPDGYYECAPAR